MDKFLLPQNTLEGSCGILKILKILKQRRSGGKGWCDGIKSQAGLLYSDDVCLMASSEEDMKVIMENKCVLSQKDYNI